MVKQIEIAVSPEIAADENLLRNEVLKKIGISSNEKIYIRQVRRSIDARSRNIKINILAEVFIGESPSQWISYKREYKNVQ